MTISTIPGFAERRDLLDNRYLEIETAYRFPEPLCSRWLKKALARGFEVYRHQTTSLYFDTDGLDFFRNGRTLRVRLSGAAISTDYATGDVVVDETYPNQFALKRRHEEFQAAARELTTRKFPEAASLGFLPSVRHEIEGENNWPVGARELRYYDLPDAHYRGHPSNVRDVAMRLIHEGKLGHVAHPEELIIKPKLMTVVERQRIRLIVDTTAGWDFRKKWLTPHASPEMLERQNFVAMEVSLDKCVWYAADAARGTITDVITDSKRGARGLRKLGSTSLFEFEVEQHKSGARATNMDVVLAFGAVGTAFTDYLLSHEYVPQPVLSKAASGYGLHADCRPGGRCHAAYEIGKLIAA
jgi:hypothetical protein